MLRPSQEHASTDFHLLKRDDVADMADEIDLTGENKRFRTDFYYFVSLIWNEKLGQGIGQRTSTLTNRQDQPKSLTWTSSLEPAELDQPICFYTRQSLDSTKLICRGQAGQIADRLGADSLGAWNGSTVFSNHREEVGRQRGKSPGP